MFCTGESSGLPVQPFPQRESREEGGEGREGCRGKEGCREGEAGMLRSRHCQPAMLRAASGRHCRSAAPCRKAGLHLPSLASRQEKGSAHLCACCRVLAQRFVLPPKTDHGTYLRLKRVRAKRDLEVKIGMGRLETEVLWLLVTSKIVEFVSLLCPNHVYILGEFVISTTV